MWVAAYNFHSFFFYLPWDVSWEHWPQSMVSSLPAGEEVWLNLFPLGLKSDEAEDILYCCKLSFFCFLLWHRKDPRGRNGLPDLPRFHHCFPKHPWNVSSWKPPFHPESPAPRTPRSPRTWRVSLLKGKQKKKENAYRRIVVQLWGYSHSARTQRATEWPPTAQGSIQKHPSTLLGFWHAKCSHCLVDDMVR